MANIKSQKKRIITNENNRQRNISTRSRIKTLTKQAMAAIDAKDGENVKVALPAALSAIDKAVTKGVLHPKSAARKKSSLQHRAVSV